MIEQVEIDTKSEELGVHVSSVQRDYVFGWVLAGLFEPTNPLARRLSLKGGNAFRKAYFENARYSNDLDFSTQTELTEDELRRVSDIARIDCSSSTYCGWASRDPD